MDTNIENLVMISSLIKTSSEPLTYSNIRSVYTHDERFEQTLKTIESVRKYIPNAQILLIDCSDFSDSQETVLKNACDMFLNVYNINNMRSILCNGPSKSLAEATQTHLVIEYLTKNKISCKNFFKISGRYALNQNFNFSFYDNDKNIGRIQPCMSTYFLTSFYKLNSETLPKLNNMILNNLKALQNGIPYEEFFRVFMSSCDNVEYLQVAIGIDEYISVNGEHRCH
jgi:hypothetical protein